jgi:hypothetical protein
LFLDDHLHVCSSRTTFAQEYLSTTPKRQKKTWHHTILKILQKETDLFEQEPQNEGSFALKERDLLRIGPMHESVIQVGIWMCCISAQTTLMNYTKCTVGTVGL